MKKKNYVFWITGLSGSGKSTIAKNIKKFIEKNYGPTLIINGDDIRKIFKFQNYSYEERLKLGFQYSDFCNFIIKQKFNVIFTVVGLFDELRNYNRKKIKNYIEIYIETDINKLLSKSKKKHYKNNIKNVWGIDISPEFPKKPHIKIKNDFKKKINTLVLELEEKLKIL